MKFELPLHLINSFHLQSLYKYLSKQLSEGLEYQMEYWYSGSKNVNPQL